MKSFSTLVGWKDTALSKSESGLYYQEANPLLTLRALRGVMPKDLADRYPAHEQGRIYNKGEKVSNGGKIYLSLKDENNQDLVNTLYWTEYDVLEDYLMSLTERGINKTCESLNPTTSVSTSRSGVLILHISPILTCGPFACIVRPTI